MPRSARPRLPAEPVGSAGSEMVAESEDRTTAARSGHRVVLLIRDLNIGGAQRQLIELATGMQRAGRSVRVVIFYGGGPLEGDLRARGVPLTVLGKRGRWDLIGFWLRLLRAIRRERPAVLHSYLGAENILSVTLRPFLRGTRVVWGVRSSNMDLRRYGRLPALMGMVERRLARFADLVICNSSTGRDVVIAHGYPAQRTVVVPNGIDVERFRPDPPARSDVRAQWAIGENEVLVGRVARLDPKKDHAAFLGAAAAVVAVRDDVRFVCVGDGPDSYRIELERMGHDLGLDRHLIWAGERLDMSRVYNALDLLVSSSSWGEGFPNVVAEAMASGVPCLVTDAGDSALVVGDSGWVCRAQDPGDLIRALRSALDHDGAAGGEELRAIGERARRRIVEQFSVEALVLATTAQLDRLVDGASGAP